MRIQKFCNCNSRAVQNCGVRIAANIIVIGRFRTGRIIIIIKWILPGYTVTGWFQTHAAIESRTITIIIRYNSVGFGRSNNRGGSDGSNRTRISMARSNLIYKPKRPSFTPPSRPLQRYK